MGVYCDSSESGLHLRINRGVPLKGDLWIHLLNGLFKTKKFNIELLMKFMKDGALRLKLFVLVQRREFL